MGSNIYFGSLEGQLADVRQDPMSVENTAAAASTAHAITSASTTNPEFERRQLARSLRIPTDDRAVRNTLIAMGQPVTQFGEGPAERRDRLRVVASQALSTLSAPLVLFPILKTLVPVDDRTQDTATECASSDDDEEFYVPGRVELVELRAWLLRDSMSRAVSAATPALAPLQEQQTRAQLAAQLQSAESFDMRASVVDRGSRPLSACAILGDGSVVVGDWGGRGLVYARRTGSSARLTESPGVFVHGPVAGRITALAASPSDRSFVSGGVDGSIQLRRLCGGAEAEASMDVDNGAALDAVSLLGHTGRIGRLAWHPSGRLLASTSADASWRLWDLNRLAVSGGAACEMQLQEGHQGGVFAGAWHPHGGLLATGGADDGTIRIWDCRAGRAIWTLSGCSSDAGVAGGGAILDIHFSPQQSHLFLSTGSDGRICFHDLRNLEATYAVIPAHSSCCTAAQFAAGGRIVVSGGHDGHVRLWAAGDGRLLRDFPIGAKAMALACVEEANGPVVVTAGYDRSLKLFA